MIRPNIEQSQAKTKTQLNRNLLMPAYITIVCVCVTRLDLDSPRKLWLGVAHKLEQVRIGSAHREKYIYIHMKNKVRAMMAYGECAQCTFVALIQRYSSFVDVVWWRELVSSGWCHQTLSSVCVRNDDCVDIYKTFAWRQKISASDIYGKKKWWKSILPNKTYSILLVSNWNTSKSVFFSFFVNIISFEYNSETTYKVICREKSSRKNKVNLR